MFYSLKDVIEKKPGRAIVWGVVVKRFDGEKYTMIIIDDFTETLPVYIFGVCEVEVGDTVRVMGRVREREGQPRILADKVIRINIYEELVHRLFNTAKMSYERVVEEEVEVI